MQYLDMSKLRGRKERNDRDGRTGKADIDFDFGPTEEVGVHRSAEEIETGCRGSQWNGKPKPEPTKKGGGKAGKTETQTWVDVIKGLGIEDELKTIDSVESRNESDVPNSIKMFDSEEPNLRWAKQTKRQPKPTPR